MGTTTRSVPSAPQSQHNLVRGIWQLLRFHTFEALSSASIGWLALFLYAIKQRRPLDTLYTPILGILGSYGITHGVFCMWNDICDRKVDGLVARTRNRPLPSGMVTYHEALWAFVTGLLISVGLTYGLLGEEVVWTMVPVWGLSFLYPLAKRTMSAPQVVLGLTMASCVLPPWVALGNDWTSLGLPASLFGAIFSWLVYVDLIYASQDRPDDEKAGVKSLAVLLGDHLRLGLSFLGLLQIIFFAMVGLEASVSTLFWIFGIGVWAICIPWSVMSLNLRDRHSGGRIFLWNAILVIYLSMAAGGEVWNASRLQPLSWF